MKWLNLTLTTRARARGNAPFVICAQHITAIEELKFGGTLIYVSGEVFKVNEDVSAVLALLGVDKGNANEYKDANNPPTGVI